mmetsp:Transcript_33267/g.98948  ORF Transcript_33267/g.98948 Transcript_33267/m.98948 type:complete len:220 (+) Transcript_33267:686-1345(+)
MGHVVRTQSQHPPRIRPQSGRRPTQRRSERRNHATDQAQRQHSLLHRRRPQRSVHRIGTRGIVRVRSREGYVRDVGSGTEIAEMDGEGVRRSRQWRRCKFGQRQWREEKGTDGRRREGSRRDVGAAGVRGEDREGIEELFGHEPLRRGRAGEDGGEGRRQPPRVEALRGWFRSTIERNLLRCGRANEKCDESLMSKASSRIFIIICPRALVLFDVISGN